MPKKWPNSFVYLFFYSNIHLKEPSSVIMHDSVSNSNNELHLNKGDVGGFVRRRVIISKHETRCWMIEAVLKYS